MLQLTLNGVMTAPDKIIGQVSDGEEEPGLEYLQPEAASGL